MCLGCVEEGYLSLETYRKIEAFSDKWPHSEFGPAHITISDSNVADHNLYFCLTEVAKALAGCSDLVDDDYPRDELEATKAFLLELLAVPEEVR